jgi:uncharacterized protein (TIGR02594 family)
MHFVNCRVIGLACLAFVMAGSNAAFARQSHHHHRSVHRVAHVHHYYSRHHFARRSRVEIQQAVVGNPYYGGAGMAQHYGFSGNEVASYAPRRVHGHYRHVAGELAAPVASFGGFGGGSLVADARRYLGTNPTGRRSLWCGAFMDKVLRDTGHRGGGNLAKGYLNYGPRVSGPQVGAIAVMGRRGGGHVGVVSGVDANGNPIVISGNHNHTVAESLYPRRRIIAYVMPNG